MSALVASSTEQDRVRELQRTLYRAAKADPKRRFHALYDKVYRRDVLERAWGQVRANRGAAGSDRITIEQVEQYGVERLLEQLAADLRAGSYRPLPARRVFIPKPGSAEQRPLSIPAVCDRIVQAATRIVIEPIFEADFLPCSFGFRPKKSQHDALQVVIDQAYRGRRWLVESDVDSCFESIPHDAVRHAVTGTPQGGVVSPLLCNVYLHRLDRVWQTRGRGVLVRFADDLLVLCRTRQEAEAALVALRAILAELGLELKERKTRIVQLREGGEGVDFLGFQHRYVRARSRRFRHITFLARWPSHRAMQQARTRMRALTGRERLLLPVDEVVQDLNAYLRGWAGYFRYGNSAPHFNLIRNYALDRLALFVAKRHQRTRSYGWWAVAYQPGQLGLIDLAGSVVAPRPHKPWREQPNAGGEGRR